MIKYYVPSFTYEKKSHGFNRMLWVFVALISMFTVGVGIMSVNACGVYVLGIISTVYTDHMAVFSVGFMALSALIMLIYGLKFVQSLLVSYKMEGDTIIKGRIQNNALGRSDNVVDEMAARVMVQHKFSSKSVMAGNTAINAYGIYELILLNRNVSFVSEYFDTNLYKKKIYENAVLKRETKYYLHYRSDNGRLTIPKVYQNIADTADNKEKSLISRIISRSVIVFATALLLSCIDLAVGYLNNPEITSTVTESVAPVEEAMTDFGYELSVSNNLKYNFTKKVQKNGESYTSSVSYSFTKDGGIKEISFKMYLPNTEYLKEAKYVLDFLEEFDDSKKQIFLEHLEESICVGFSTDTYYILQGEKETVRIGTSGGCINIHSY